MSQGWGFYIAILTIANILGCVWLLWWTAKKRPGDRAETDTTGHAWDGITEWNKPLPRWWLNLFYITVVFALVYLALYPGLGIYAGTKGWTQEGEHAKDVAAADAAIKPLFAKFAQVPLPELGKNPEAMALGRSVFANNCVTCHGSDARGAKGFPNLVDEDWLWGGTPDDVLKTILEGRQAAMPPLGVALGDQGVTEAAVYVQALAGMPVDAALAQAGKLRFDGLCAACHGADAKGNHALGAPNLTDGVWLYGSDFRTISDTIRNGRAGHMPPHRDILGEDRARLAAAFVLSHQKAPASP